MYKKGNIYYELVFIQSEVVISFRLKSRWGSSRQSVLPTFCMCRTTSPLQQIKIHFIEVLNPQPFAGSQMLACLLFTHSYPGHPENTFYLFHHHDM